MIFDFFSVQLELHYSTESQRTQAKIFTVVDSETDLSQPALINDACTQSH